MIEKTGPVSLTRRMEISTAHSYTLDRMPLEERLAVFGKSAATHAHGHNYDVRATVRGPMDAGLDWVMNILELDRIMREVIDRQLDHRHANLEAPKLRNRWPTLETLALFIWEEMAACLPPSLLFQVQIFENPDFYAECRGENEMIRLTRVYRFSAAHRLHNSALGDDENREIFGRCNNLHGHGHDYVLEVTVAGFQDTKTDCIIDIGAMDREIQRQILDRFDHVHLNLDTEEFRSLNPTSENMVIVFWGLLKDSFAPAKLERLRLWETSKSCFDYCGPSE